MKKYAALLALGAGLVYGQPSISANGIVNAASYAFPELPQGAIAQGSMFVIFGQNMGPASIVLATSYPLGTSGGLGGTSVRVSAGGQNYDCPMIYSLASQVAALMPSRVPVGPATISVTYNGQTSATRSVTVTRSSFGIFTQNSRGSGAAIIQNFESQTSTPLNTLRNSARPGQVAILWGTGLGPITADDAAGPAPGDLGTDVALWIGGVRASILYRGRSGTVAGIDQINFTVPSGLQGCSVSVAVQIGNNVSNFATMAIMPNGGTCADPNTGLSSSDLDQLSQLPQIKIGSITLNRSVTAPNPISIPGLPPGTPIPGAQETISDSASAAFLQIAGIAAGTQIQDVIDQVTFGSCTVFFFRGTPTGTPSIPFSGLDAGDRLPITGPGGFINALTKTVEGFPLPAGFYSYSGTNAGQGPGLFLNPGTYTITGSGGAQVGAFSSSLTMPPTFTWTNRDTITNVTRSQGVTVTWTGGDPAGDVQISGSSFTGQLPNVVFASFTCTERNSAGRFTVPPVVLLALPPSSSQGAGGISIPTGNLSLTTQTVPSRFNAPGIDIGFIQAAFSSGKSLNYQ